MTRETFVTSRGWKVVMTIVSLMNAFFNWPQAWKVWIGHETAGLSPPAFWMLLIVQVGFTTHGWCLRDRFLSTSGTIASLTTAVILAGMYRF